MTLGPTGHELPKLKNFTEEKPKSSRLQKFTKTAPEPTTRAEAATKMVAAIDRFKAVEEGDGFNSALYGFVKDAARYYISVGESEESAFEKTLESVLEHPAYLTWGQLDTADETTFESAFDACVAEDNFWDLHTDDDFDPFNPPDYDVETIVLKHLWQDKMISGAVGLLVGDGGVGKSTVLMKVAAKISHGTLPGYFKGQKGFTLFYSMEDEQRAVFNPRMLASGADHRYVKFMGKGSDTGLHFPHDMEILRGELMRYKGQVRLVVFDPLEAYMATGARTNETKEVADLMHSLNQVAAEFHCTILGIKHFNKMADSTLTHKVSGSLAYVNQSRFVLAAIKTESFEDDQTCCIGVFKGNTINPLVKGALYRINTTTYEPSIKEKEGDTGVTAYAKFDGESDECVEVEDIKRQIKAKKDREGKKEEQSQTKSQQARLWLITLLNKNGPMKFAQIQEHREKSQAAPTKSTLESTLREFVSEEPRRKSKDLRYLMDHHWVKELIEIAHELPDGTPLPTDLKTARTKIEAYRDRTNDGLVNSWLEVNP